MAEYLEELNVGILVAIGGDGTLRGAQTIAEEAARRDVTVSVIGVSTTIDNDISFVQRTFGFETAVTEARRATDAANAEAKAARNRIGLVKLMGRDSGFIAEPPVQACADLPRRLRAPEDRPARRAVEQRGGLDRSAVEHAVIMTVCCEALTAGGDTARAA